MKKVFSILVALILLCSVFPAFSDVDYTWFCLHCEQPNEEGSKCSTCGQEKGNWWCGSCGRECTAKNKACPSCGTSLEDSSLLIGQDYYTNEYYEGAYVFLRVAALAGNMEAAEKIAHIYLVDYFHSGFASDVEFLEAAKQWYISNSSTPNTKKLLFDMALKKVSYPDSSEKTGEVIVTSQPSGESGGGGKERSRCPRCHGLGTEDCYRCSGKGWEKCSSCRGTGRKDCISCGGRGKVKTYHSGSGYTGIGSGSWEYERCSSCYGRGYKDCFTCSGDGRIDCSNCLRKGYVKCSRCHGSGYDD